MGLSRYLPAALLIGLTQIARSRGDPDQAGQLVAAEQELAQVQAALQPIEMEATQYNAWADELCKDD